MHLFASFILALLACLHGVGVGASWPWGGSPWYHDNCLTWHQASSIINQFIFLLENSNSTKFAPAAKKLLAPGFMDESDSVNFMAGFPLGSVTFPTRREYIKIAGSQEPFGSVKTVEMFHNCNKIGWRWNATGFAPPDLEVVGINIFTINNPRNGKVNSIHTEFNSGAFLANLGNPQCNKSAK